MQQTLFEIFFNIFLLLFNCYLSYAYNNNNNNYYSDNSNHWLPSKSLKKLWSINFSIQKIHKLETLQSVQSMEVGCAVHFFFILIIMIAIERATGSNCYSNIACYLHSSVTNNGTRSIFGQQIFFRSESNDHLQGNKFTLKRKI